MSIHSTCRLWSLNCIQIQLNKDQHQSLCSQSISSGQVKNHDEINWYNQKDWHDEINWYNQKDWSVYMFTCAQVRRWRCPGVWCSASSNCFF